MVAGVAVDAVFDSVSVATTYKGKPSFSPESFCGVRANWQRINDAIRQALENITLAEMTHPISAELVTLGGGTVEAGAER